ncbi:DNA mismatch repair protein [Aspergillus sclerotioniger CBS 115572]|uniref:DNA mismatch repair protein PMS1 n=1 Tax=Aspergillus sclerotioniger CBS 115572 TaxID=1450535 RepID=A0A317WWF9_9EURO|nr:DNA mismatch repair protein [Aspergillus sclerotioniger CBS 115572]PWY89517.1 DNA mismatch repair protein [Aspergillus sclerotioniger CBS 115572]
MATIKAIEARSVHQIQSGQVIVDLCSVAKELVENSLDAGATSIVAYNLFEPEVRFKNNGLDLIEVQDNGSGIAPENYENVALKHYTSKLSSFDDLSRLHTFGFRGEALSSLCALSDFHVTTAQANQAPKATRLDFEHSGKLKKTQIVAGQKGTTASVEGLFKGLPVRRRELEKNIKREYGKVLNLLHAYACVSTGVRFGVRNSVGKTRNVVVFSTNGNQTTKENIANVYGAKTLLALIPLDLALEFEPSAVGRRTAGSGEMNKISVRGHVSRPVFGEGRQTPDRQMFFVNSRPCGLPQIAKAFNEVYRSFNVSQSPFVFADFQMDTNAYDVNVSPDKRTILLHDAGALIDSLKDSLTQLFESSDQTVPQSQVVGAKQSAIKQRLGNLPQTPSRPQVDDTDASEPKDQEPDGSQGTGKQSSSQDRMKSFLSGLSARESRPIESSPADSSSGVQELPERLPQTQSEPIKEDNELFVRQSTPAETLPSTQDENARPAEEVTQQNEDRSSQGSAPDEPSRQVDPLEETPNTIQNAFDRMRPRRMPAEVATITIGNKTVTSMVGSGLPRKRSVGASDAVGSPTARKRRIYTPSRPSIFGKHMRDFAAPGTQLEPESEDDKEVEEEVMEEEGIEDSEEGEDLEEEEEEEIEEIEVEEADDCSQPYAPSDHGSDHLPGVSEEDHNQEANNDVEPDSQPGSQNMDEEEKRHHEEAEVQRLIQEAEQAALPQGNNIHRANKMNKGAGHRDSTVQLMSTMDGSFSKIKSQLGTLQESLRHWDHSSSYDEPENEPETAEERLSLTVSKEDFASMRIVGQFNLGFILATRSSNGDAGAGSSDAKDELFIIDQHASDEKFNFERLQAETIVQYQRLVQPKCLDLTAVEEEIVIENQEALEKNGFIVEIDESGNEPIGRRCKLVSLPLSKEVVFGVRDLEELIVLLSETPTNASRSASDVYIPRPGKVRKMFAMRACRSSIMIGKNLTVKQMKKVVTNMGTIDKPWNCPHGRPTMRHLMSLGQWNEWDEFGDYEEDEQPAEDRLGIWREYLQEVAGHSDEPDDDE